MKSLAVITGASRGIGLAAAEQFLADKWDVVNLSRTKCVLKGVVNYDCDLSDDTRLRAVLEKLDLRPYGRVSLIHNAAVFPEDRCDTLTSEQLLETLKVNVVAPQVINQTLVGRLPAGSSIIFVGSTLSEVGTKDRLSYVTSKHALMGLMRATAQDLAGRNIHTCLVCPGFTDTKMLRDAIGDDKARLDSICGSVLMGRLVEPGEIARLIVFCSSNPSINGSVLHANLGQR